MNTPHQEEQPASAVFDKGRRGNPLPGCDCVQCFGYCMIDGDEADAVLRRRASVIADSVEDAE